MSGQGFDLGALGDMLSSLRPQDIAALQGMAQSLFSGAGQGSGTGAAGAPPTSGAGFGAGASSGSDFESLARMASLLELLQSERADPRTALLQALRPLLSEQRRPRIDQAVRMLQLLSLLPKIRGLM